MIRLTTLAVVTCASAFVAGLVLAFVGSVRAKLADRLAIGEGRVGWLLAVLHLALIPTTLLAGTFADRYGARVVLFTGSLMVALALVALALRTDFASSLVSAAAAGVGAACLNTGAVVLMPIAFDFASAEAAASVNLGFVFVALGALMAPALADLLLRRADLRRALGVMALVCLVPALLAAASGKFGVPHSDAALAKVVSEPNYYFWMLAAAFLLYAPLEFAIGAWGTNYLATDHRFSERGARRVLTLFTLAFLAARLLTAVGLHAGALRDSWAPMMVFVLALAAAVALGNLAGGARTKTVASAMIGLGFVLGPIFPLLTALAIGRFSEAPGTAYGAMFAVGSVGSLVTMPLLSYLFGSARAAQGLRLLTPLPLLLVVVALAIWLT